MLTKSAEIGTQVVQVTCADELEAAGTWLLGVLARMHEAGSRLRAGTRIALGWSVITLRGNADGTGLVVCAPDFSRDPFTDEIADLSVALEIQMRQNAFVERAGVHGAATSFQDKIVLAQGCLQRDRLCMTHGEPQPEAGDSGWYVDSQERGNTTPPLEALYAYQLLNLRPELVPALLLPVGHMVLASKGAIDVVLNQDNEVVLQD